MRNAIRVAVCVVMAATATSVSAGASDEDVKTTTEGQHCFHEADAICTDAVTMGRDDEAGGGRGEPAASKVKEDAAKEEAAIQEYNQQQFLNQIWTSE